MTMCRLIRKVNNCAHSSTDNENMTLCSLDNDTAEYNDNMTLRSLDNDTASWRKLLTGLLEAVESFGEELFVFEQLVLLAVQVLDTLLVHPQHVSLLVHRRVHVGHVRLLAHPQLQQYLLFDGADTGVLQSLVAYVVANKRHSRAASQCQEVRQCQHDRQLHGRSHCHEH